KYFFGIYLILSSTTLFSQNSNLSISVVSPLALYSSEWNDEKYGKCNTAADADYLSDDEKKIINILNLVRTDPAFFAKTVLKKYPSRSGKAYLADDAYYYQSLVSTLLKLEPKALLYPDNLCFISAQCHASTSGARGYVGHDRKSKECKAKQHYFGECCDYGHSDPLEIVLSLLVDEGVSSLGHRNICLGAYSKI